MYRQGSRKMKIGKKLFIIVTVLFLFLLYAGKIVRANDNRIIRVVYYPMENYHSKDKNGNVVGYETDFLNRIAEITGWKYEYIEAESWLDAFRLLRENEADLVSPCQIAEDRMSEFSFSATPMGKMYGAVLTMENNDCTYEDFEAFSNMTFGIEAGGTFQEYFERYENENGFKPKYIATFQNYDDMKKALKEGKIDAMIANIMRTEDDMKLLGKFGKSSFYFMFRKDDEELRRKLNDAMYTIDMTDLAYEQKLLDTYFPIYNMETMTKEETEFAEGMRPLIVGCPVNVEPVGYIDEKTGEISGITRRILDEVAANCGLTFEYRALPDTEITYDVLREYEIDLIAGIEYNSMNANTGGIKLSSPYFEAQKVMVGYSGREIKKDQELKIAVVSGSQTLKWAVKEQYPNGELVKYKTVEEAMDAICDGTADVLLQNQYAVDMWLSKPKYEQLYIVPTEGIDDFHCLSPFIYKEGNKIVDGQLSDPRLITVINKGIKNLSKSEVSNIIVNESTQRHYKFTLGDFVYRYRYLLIALFIVSALGIAVIIYAYEMKKRNLRLQLEGEQRLKNIADNINGGVLILQLTEDYPITYANDGFYNLMRYGKKEERNKPSYIKYIRPGDTELFEKRIEEGRKKRAQISMRLWMKRGDGSELPVMFNGTFAEDENRVEKMFCVIMDISEEVAMLEQIQVEEEKHRLMIEKAEEIIYEIDLKKQEVNVSETFSKKFGWTFQDKGDSFNSREMIKGFKVYKEDESKLEAMLTVSMEKGEDTQEILRIENADGTFRYCRMEQFVMTDSSGRTRLLIGRITDIDKEMREKEKLKKKTQLDSLTGLYNKEGFRKASEKYLRENSGKESALLFIDLDNFKSVNDLLGHMCGDRALMDAAGKLKAFFGTGDYVGRFGGDEFCVFIRDVTEISLGDKLEQLVKIMNHTYGETETTVTVTGSIGAAHSNEAGHIYEELLECADKALYNAKENGKNQFEIYKENGECQ